MQGNWQLVMVCWGTKYGQKDINRLHRAACKHSKSLSETIVITDRERVGLDEGIRQVDFPEFFLKEEFRGAGCQAKLAMFEEGLLTPDMPAVFVDLDSVILGDLGKIVRSVRDDQIGILRSTALPAGVLMSFVYKLSKRRFYTRGNSSIVVFRPSENVSIAREFREIHLKHGNAFKPTKADERFISWSAQERLTFIDRRYAVKFTREFMSKSLRWLRVVSRMGSVERRRRNLLFVTFNQDAIKPDQFVGLAGDKVVQDRKGRKTQWNEGVLGSSMRVFEDYFST